MGLLRDTVHDAMRPLPGAPVLRRSATADFDDEGGADPGAMTVYRFQKDGGERPPMAPLRGPSITGGGVPDGTAVAGGVAFESIVHPLIGLNVGFERSEEITPVANARMLPSQVQSDALSGASESPARYVPVSVPVAQSPVRNVEDLPVVAHAPAQRHEASFVGSQAARGAPSGSLSIDATVTPAHAQALGDPRLLPREGVSSSPAQVRRQRERANADTGLRIGRIDVTVIADAPRAAPSSTASSLADSRFLSRHYLRRT